MVAIKITNNNNFLFMITIILIIIVIGFQSKIYAQVNSIAFFEITNTIGEGQDYNKNNRGDNPFNNIRARLFLNSRVGDDLGVFLKFSFDADVSKNDYESYRIDGGYFLFDKDERFKVKFGKIPSSIGSFSERNYLERNSLIGSPLLYSHKSNLSGFRLETREYLYNDRGSRSGVNLIYEACWNDGIELLGTNGVFDYKVSLTNGSLANPKSGSNDGVQILSRIGFEPITGLKAGIGYANAPYLSGKVTDVALNKKNEDYRFQIIAADFEYSKGYLEIYSEFAYASYDIENGNTSASLSSYFIEGKYKITPRLYTSTRFGQVLYDNLKLDNGTSFSWNYDISRIETGIGYKINRKAIIKGVWQYNYFSDSPLKNQNFIAIQIKTQL